MFPNVADWIRKYEASFSLSKGSRWWALLTWIPEHKEEPLQAEGFGDSIEEALDAVMKNAEEVTRG